MQHTIPTFSPRGTPRRTAPISPWSLRAWPPVLWQAGQTTALQLHHLGTHVTLCGEPSGGVAGQTLWGSHDSASQTGVAWDWVQVSHGVVAMADPLSVITNLRLLGDSGEVLTSWQAARFLNEIVHALPWQHEVNRALQLPH